MEIKPFFVMFLFLVTIVISTLSPAIHAGGEKEKDNAGVWHYIHLGSHGKNCNANSKLGKKLCWETFTGLTCCKKKCVDLKEDKDNCGSCGTMCGYNTKCCSGKCINVASNAYHCGRCNKKCPKKDKCHNGMCGYAS